MKVLHVVPDSADEPRHRFSGSTKDAGGRTEYFAARGFEVTRIPAKGRSDAWVCEALAQLPLEELDAAVFELPLYPRSLRLLARRSPRTRRFVRPINAELLHDVHRAVARWKYEERRVRGVAREAREALRRLRLDALCARRAHAVLSITEWESRHYWRWLAGAERVVTVPYFLPEWARTPAASPPKKRPLCVCLGSTTRTLMPFNADAIAQFSRAVTALGGTLPEWSFVLTGDAQTKGARPEAAHVCDRIERVGLLDSPFEVLQEAAAMALLGDLGFGFKTKLLDAAEAGCWSIVTPRLWARLPEVVRPGCIVLECATGDAMRAALERAIAGPPPPSPNAALRREAFAALDRVFGVAPESAP